MPDVWRYVVRYDHGVAPHATNDMLTLCICKPVIRKHAEVEDYILGFNSARYDSNTLIWAGRVSEKLLMGEYAQKYPKRADVIYRRSGWDEDGYEKLDHYSGPLHNTEGLIQRDIRGRYSLIFKSFWYWGKNAITLPVELHELLYNSVGQKKKLLRPELLSELKDWLNSMEKGIHGTPRDAIIQQHG